MTTVCICWLKLQKFDYNARNGQYKIRWHYYFSVNYSSISLKERHVMHSLAMHDFEKRGFYLFNFFFSRK